MFKDPETGMEMPEGDGEPDWQNIAETMQARRWVEEELDRVEEGGEA